MYLYIYNMYTRVFHAGAPCAAHEIFYLPPPGILASKFLVIHI